VLVIVLACLSSSLAIGMTIRRNDLEAERKRDAANFAAIVAEIRALRPGMTQAEIDEIRARIETLAEQQAEIELVPGPRGARGEKGDRGDSGDTIAGPQGEKGDPGESIVGPAGPAGESIVGPTGPPGADSTVPGPPGATGAQGSPGPAALSFSFVGNDCAGSHLCVCTDSNGDLHYECSRA
jgi:hypothetical protein